MLENTTILYNDFTRPNPHTSFTPSPSIFKLYINNSLTLLRSVPPPIFYSGPLSSLSISGTNESELSIGCCSMLPTKLLCCC